jgi:UDPglucose 6-dehydrogenase
LPKDTKALLHASTVAGWESGLLRAALVSNQRQHQRIAGKVREAAGGCLDGKHIGLLGLTFKAGTNDLRDSPALAVADLLAAERARLTAFDPAVRHDVAGITVATDPYQAVTGAAVVVLLTGWPQFASLDWRRIGNLMAGSTIVDSRNHLDPAILSRAGLQWEGLGRPQVTGSAQEARRSGTSRQ